MTACTRRNFMDLTQILVENYYQAIFLHDLVQSCKWALNQTAHNCTNFSDLNYWKKLNQLNKTGLVVPLVLPWDTDSHYTVGPAFLLSWSAVARHKTYLGTCCWAIKTDDFNSARRCLFRIQIQLFTSWLGNKISPMIGWLNWGAHLLFIFSLP